MYGSNLPDGSENPSRLGDASLQSLLVEDNPGDARLFGEYLREGSIEATLRHEETLQDGLDALEEERPDVLVADLGLPDSAGTETVEAAAAAAPGVPIVVLTGQDDLQGALKAQEAGASEYLQKEELTPTLVGRTLRWAVQRRRMQAKLQQRDAWIRSITERLSAGVFRAGPTGQIEYANDALAEMLGFEEADELIGRDLTAFSPDRLRWGQMLGEEPASDVEVEFEGRGDSSFIGLLRTKGAYDNFGAVLHYDGVITDVTDRVRREKRLRMLSKALEQTKETVLITEAKSLDKPGPRIAYANQAFEKMTGYSEEEVLGETPRILQGPETDPAELEALRDALEAGNKWSGETVNYRKDGESYRIQWSVSPVRNEDGDIEHWVSVQRDVTERRRRQRELERQNDFFEKAQKIAKVGAWEYDVQAHESTWTEKAHHIVGLPTSADTTPENTFDIYHPEDRPRVRAAFRQAVEKGEPFDLEVRIVTKDDKKWVRIRGEPQRGSESNAAHVVRVRGTIRDITERKHRERQLAVTSQRLEAILEHTTRPMFVKDRDGEYLLTNQRFRELLGIEEGEALGRTDEDLFPPEMARVVQENDQKVLREGTSLEEEERIQVDGEWRTYLSAKSALYDVGTERNPDAPVALFGTATDITERKRRERELVDAKKEAERMNHLKSAFLANMSHEIRTPLTSILGFADAIGDEVGGAQTAGDVDLATLDQFSSLIGRSGHRLMDTLTGVLNLSKLQAGEMNLELGPLDLVREAKETVDEFGPQADEADLRLTVQEGSGPVWARADEGGLQIVLRNLVSNSIKYTEEGGQVWVRARQEENVAIIEVEDTGIGMDPATVSGLFDAFKQASEGVERKYEGTGLGLTVTKEMLDHMGGSIEVETEKGQGSRFILRLPKAKQKEPSSQPHL